jgi:iron(III) transport system substrate-binding protein
MSAIRSMVVTGAVVFTFIGASAQAQDRAPYLNLFCSVPAAWCSLVAAEFEKDAGIKVTIINKSSPEILALLAEERGKPSSDVWFGGSEDNLPRASKLDLVAEYRSPALGQLRPWAQRAAEQAKFRSTPLYMRVVAIGYNTELAARKKIAPPACWKDLAKPQFAGQLNLAKPSGSGATYTMIATLVQLFGEEEAFKYLVAQSKNVSAYPKNAALSVQAVAHGNAVASVAFLSDIVAETGAGAPVKAVVPCEGTGFELGGIAIVKGARNLDNAKKFVDWALGAKAQALAANAKQFHLPSNAETPISPLVPKIADIKLIDYDTAKYATAVEHRHLIDRWTTERAPLAEGDDDGRAGNKFKGPASRTK